MIYQGAHILSKLTSITIKLFERMRIYSVGSSSLLSLSKIAIFALMCLFFWYPLIFDFLFDFPHWHLSYWFFSNWIKYYSRQPKTKRFFLGWFVAVKVFFNFKIFSIINWLFIKFFSYDAAYLIPNRFIFF